jgi:hypothetical protein
MMTTLTSLSISPVVSALAQIMVDNNQLLLLPVVSQERLPISPEMSEKGKSRLKISALMFRG